jgi:tetratricopeptide (TPR) repeat protein
MELSERKSKIERIVFWGIVLLLVFAPLAFGSVHVWAYSITAITVFSLISLHSIDQLFISRPPFFEWIKTPVNWILLLLFLILSLQLIPLPESFLNFLSPQTAADKAALRDVLSASGNGARINRCLAYYRNPVIVEGFKLAAYAGFFFLVIYTVKTRRQVNFLIYLLVGVGLFEAIYATYQVFSDTPRVWWWRSRFGLGHRASGTYIGSNHFAGYLEMMIPLTFGFMLAQKKRIKEKGSELCGNPPFIKRLVAWFSPESANPKMIFLFFSAVVMGVALLLSGSRGGIISLSTSFFLCSFLFFLKSGLRKYGLFTLSLCLFAFLYGLQVGIDPTLKRFEQPENLVQRLYVSASMIPMLKDFPVLGVGWGNFRYLYPRYMPKDFDGVSSSGYAHDDWLEAGTEIGYIGLGLILTAILVYVYRMIRIWMNRRDPYALGIGAGVITAILSLGFHSLFDLNMHIPANPMTLAAIAAVGYAALHMQKRGSRVFFFYRKREFKPRHFQHILITSLTLFFMGINIFAAVRHLYAETKCPTEWNSTLNLNWNPYLAEIRKAIEVNPGNAEYHWKAAGYYIAAKVQDEALRKEYNEAAIGYLENAVRLNPARGTYWFTLGKRYSFRSYDPVGYLEKWLPLSEDCFDIAVKCAPMDSTISFDVGWYWVWRASILPEEPDDRGQRSEVRERTEGGGRKSEASQTGGAEGEAGASRKDAKARREREVGRQKPERIRFREDGIRKFQELFRRSLDIRPERWKKAVDRVWEYFPDEAVVMGILPSNEHLQSQAMKYLIEKKSPKIPTKPAKG